jgi:hypothetical protein
MLILLLCLVTMSVGNYAYVLEGFLHVQSITSDTFCIHKVQEHNEQEQGVIVKPSNQ